MGSNYWIGLILYWCIRKKGLTPSEVSLLLIVSITVGSRSTQLY